MGQKKGNPKQSGYSSATASILGIVSEGEIEGLVKGGQSIYFNETPLQNTDLSVNFQDVTWDWRSGTQGQSRIPGFTDGVSSENNVETEVKNLLPVTRNITNNNLDIIRIRLGVVLQQTDDKGKVEGSGVYFKIYIKQGTGAFNLVLDTDIHGYFPNLTEFEYAFPVNNMGGTITSFAVRIERTNPQDTDTQRYQKILTWRSYTEITEVKLSYPSSALFGFRFKTEQFQQGVPQIGLELAGRRIQIPTNATVSPTRGLIYNGIWNGAFYTPAKAVVDPAWILYDLMINSRYGLGKYIKPSQVNKWVLYEISQYCNEYVSDGYGGSEHRFSCNVLLENKEDAYKVIQSIVSIFRGFSYWIDGAIAVAADKPGNPIAQFTQADVEEGLFVYAGTGLKTRKTIAIVSWSNPEDLYKRTVETCEDPDGIEKYGVRESEISAFACTSRGQARRAGMAALLTDRLEQETVIFKARAYAAYTQPGDIIRIMDSHRAEIRYGGLIKQATTTSITLDNPVTLLANNVYSISVMLSNGNLSSATVLNQPGTFETLTVSGFSAAPPSESNWMLTTQAVEPQLFRVLNRVPLSGTMEMMHEITAVEYNPAKYALIESGFNFEPLPAKKTPPIPPSIPRNIVLSYSQSDLFEYLVKWDYPLLNNQKDPYTNNYVIQLRAGDLGFWEDSQTSYTLSYSFKNLSEGKYYVRIAAIDINGNSSNWVESDPIILSKNDRNWVANFTSKLTSVFAMEF